MPINDAAKKMFKHAVESGCVHGLLALNQERTQAVGWCGVDMRSDLPGHDSTFPLPDDDSKRWSVHCFFVHHKHRRSGLAKALVAAAEDFVRDKGVDLLEGYLSPGDSEQVLNLRARLVYTRTIRCKSVSTLTT